MEDTKELKVFVSCPGDLSNEKDMVKKVCDDMNNVLMQTKSSFRFKVLDYRDLIFPSSGRVQAEINFRFDGYDCYIGMLWMRFGTPSGELNPSTGIEYQSGTEEEFEIARVRAASGEKLKMYFFFKDSGPTKIPEETESLLKIQNFKRSLRPSGSNSFPNEPNSLVFNNAIQTILNIWVRTLETSQRMEDKREFFEDVERGLDIKFEVGDMVEKAVELKQAIPRTISAYQIKADLSLKLFGSESKQTLIAEVKNSQHIVLLGSAGSGKSTELANLAHYYSKEQSDLIAVYQKLNTYVDEPIDDFLPNGWQIIPKEICLIILDGLDEVEPSKFNTAVRKILSFVDKYPALRIVVSCRTNFYDFQNDATGGLLTGFDVFFMDDIQSGRIGEYAMEKYQMDATDFINSVYKNGLSDMLNQPFFLNILLSEFDKRGDLDVDKVTLMNAFVESRIAFDQTHFKNTMQLAEKKDHIVRLLKRLALTMESLGRNYLSNAELLQVLTDHDDLELVKFSAAFNRFEGEPDKWGFEHNNIQEFLAALSLQEVTVEDIKSFLSFNNTRIKPSWLNTLFFLMSIVNEEKRNRLVEWILQIEPEVLVKIEPDKIDVQLRMQIFERIFDYYKTRKIWIRSNKFTSRELARFVPYSEGNEFLLKEIKDVNSSRTSRINAAELVKYQALDAGQLKETRSVVLDFIEEYPDDQHIFHSAANVLTILDLVDKSTLERLMERFGDRNNQYIRSGFYQMIIKAKLVDEYIDYLVAGIGFSEDESDRDQVNLMDEDLLLLEALSGNLNYHSLVKLIAEFKDPHSRKILTYSNKHDVLRNMVTNAVLLYRKHSDLLQQFIGLLSVYGSLNEESLSNIIATFFTSTGTQLEVFKSVFADKKLGVYEKSILYRNLLTIEAVDFVIKEYIDHNLTNADLKLFYDNVKWFSDSINNDAGIKYLKEQVLEKSNILDGVIEVDNQKINQERALANMNLYFSVDEFKAEIKTFFEDEKIDEITWDELWALNRKVWESPNSLREPIFDLLVYFARERKVVSLTEILAFLDQKEKAEDYFFGQLKDKFNSNSNLEPTSEQLEQLSLWVNSRASQHEVLDAIKISPNDSSRISYNKQVMIIWYFVCKFNIIINQEKILDFTTYDDFLFNRQISLDFQVIEKQVGKKKVGDRVVANLKNGLDNDRVWSNNAHYAMDNRLKGSYRVILSNIEDGKKSIYSRRSVLGQYLILTKDENGVVGLLSKLGTDPLRWDVIDMLIRDNLQADKIQHYLIEILANRKQGEDEKFIAAKYLTKLGNQDGTTYYLDYLLEHADPSFDYYSQAAYMRSIKSPIFIPKLIRLLEVAHQPRFILDDFNRLDGIISDALYNIGMSSDENLQLVKTKWEEFIHENEDKIENIKFYFTTIDNMDYQFYLAKSQNASVKDALIEISKIELRQE